MSERRLVERYLHIYITSKHYDFQGKEQCPSPVREVREVSGKFFSPYFASVRVFCVRAGVRTPPLISIKKKKKAKMSFFSRFAFSGIMD
jgi:hypothetical protein